MKTRQGFVSNSSSSSFIVAVSDITSKALRRITKRTENMLLRHGFAWVNTCTPTDLEVFGSHNMLDKIISTEYPKMYDGKLFFAFLGKYVSCNQSEVIEFLIKHHVPFKASIHSGHETIIFDGKKLTEITNYGMIHEVAGFPIDLETYDKKELEKFRKVSKSVYCSDGKMPQSKDFYF